MENLVYIVVEGIIRENEEEIIFKEIMDEVFYNCWKILVFEIMVFNEI